MCIILSIALEALENIHCSLQNRIRCCFYVCFVFSISNHRIVDLLIRADVIFVVLDCERSFNLDLNSDYHSGSFWEGELFRLTFDSLRFPKKGDHI